MPAAELGAILDQSFDIAVRPGLHCAPYIHKALGTFPDGLVRVSTGPFNTAADIDTLIGGPPGSDRRNLIGQHRFLLALRGTSRLP